MTVLAIPERLFRFTFPFTIGVHHVISSPHRTEHCPRCRLYRLIGPTRHTARATSPGRTSGPTVFCKQWGCRNQAGQRRPDGHYGQQDEGHGRDARKNDERQNAGGEEGTDGRTHENHAGWHGDDGHDGWHRHGSVSYT